MTDHSARSSYTKRCHDCSPRLVVCHRSTCGCARLRAVPESSAGTSTSSRALHSWRAWKWVRASHSISCRPSKQPQHFEMPPDQRPIPRFIAEPPHDALPYGRWADQLRGLFVEACDRIEADEDIGSPGEVTWYPERTLNRRTYVPATAPTSEGFEVFGYVAFEHGPDGETT